MCDTPAHGLVGFLGGDETLNPIIRNAKPYKLDRRTLDVTDDAVKIFDGAQAVASQLQRVGQQPQPCIAGVKRHLLVEGRLQCAIQGR